MLSNTDIINHGIATEHDTKTFVVIICKDIQVQKIKISWAK